MVKRDARPQRGTEHAQLQSACTASCLYYYNVQLPIGVGELWSDLGEMRQLAQLERRRDVLVDPAHDLLDLSRRADDAASRQKRVGRAEAMTPRRVRSVGGGVLLSIVSLSYGT